MCDQQSAETGRTGSLYSINDQNSKTHQAANLEQAYYMFLPLQKLSFDLDRSTKQLAHISFLVLFSPTKTSV